MTATAMIEASSEVVQKPSIRNSSICTAPRVCFEAIADGRCELA